jgi:UDP-N-acetylmuramoylalanine--D-glutamate ligase
MSALNTNGLKVIVGLGKTGLACAKFLYQMGIPIAVTDTRSNPPCFAELKASCPNIPIIVGGLDPELLTKAETLVMSPGLSLQEPLIAARLAAGIPAIGDIELFAKIVQAPVCAITGSNAKSTVTSLVGEMAVQAGVAVRVGGNLGIPVLDLVRKNEPDMYVLELSSFQLETTQSLKPAAACILNISPDHLDRYKNMDEYIAAKHRIYQGAKWIVYNRDDELTKPHLIMDTSANIITFGLSEPNGFEFGIVSTPAGEYLALGEDNLLCVNELQIKGRHNWMNALAALALGYAMNLPMSAMLRALLNFKGLPHRCELVGKKNGVSWYNDSKGTNVGSTLAAIEGIGRSIQGKLILIMGGLGKGQDFSALTDPLTKYAKLVLLIGQDAKLIGAAVSKGSAMEYATSLEEAVSIAYERAHPGDVILLSPACASFDMFKDYVHRGEEFKRIVQGYLA